MKLCSTGHGNPDDAQFCQVCGLALQSTPPSFPQQASATPPVGPAGGYPPPGSYPPPMAPGGFTPPAPSSSNKVLLGVGIGVGAVLLLVVIAVVFVQLSQPKVQDVTVNLELYNGLDSCSVGLGYFDIPGAPILIETDDGTLYRGNLSSQGRDQGLSCLFTGTVSEVPANADNYAVSLGGGRRGEFNYSQSEMESFNWTVDLTLGS